MTFGEKNNSSDLDWFLCTTNWLQIEASGISPLAYDVRVRGTCGVRVIRCSTCTLWSVRYHTQ